MSKLTHIFEAVGPGYSAGMWFVVNQTDTGCTLWECYAWEGQNEPPTVVNQDGYRWRTAGKAVHLGRA